MNQLASALLAAFITGAVFTKMVRRAALALGVVDAPDGVRKLHPGAVPLLGGIAVLIAWTVGLLASWTLCGKSAMQSGTSATALILGPVASPGYALFLAVGVALVTGLLDDLFDLRARWKLLGQTVAAGILIAGGLVVKRLWFFGHPIELGWSGLLLTLFWLVGSMNAFNMLDGLDGLAATIGLIVCLTLAIMACFTQTLSLGVVAAAFAGALAGFLMHNLPPARIFLGDSGSTLIGLVLGAVAMEGSFKRPATAAFAVPILLLIIPIFDGMAAVVRRRLTGVPITAPDRGHIHHLLRQRGWSDRRIVTVAALFCATTSLLALLTLYVPRSEPFIVLAALVVVVCCVITKLFGYYEYLLLFGALEIFWTAFFAALRVDRVGLRNVQARLRQCKSVDEAWTILIEMANLLRLRKLELHLSEPCAYKARWISSEPVRQHPAWSATLPLVKDDKQFGRLSVEAYPSQRSVLSNLLFAGIVAETLVSIRGALHANDGAVMLFPDVVKQTDRCQPEEGISKKTAA